jgi:bacterial/archaeal transporter family protein
MDLQLAIYAGLTILLWGAWGFFGKIAISRGMAPMGIFIAEIAVGCVCALCVFPFSAGRARTMSGWNVFGVLSGLGLAIGLLFYYLALQRGHASLVVPLTAVYPLVSVVLANRVLGERLRPLEGFGIVLTVVGVTLMLLGSLHRPS